MTEPATRPVAPTAWAAWLVAPALALACSKPADTGSDSDPTPIGSPVDVVAGWGHSCARFESERLKCWGYNSNGALGLGDTEHRGDDPGEMGSSLPFVGLGPGRSAQALVAGDWHNCVLLDDGRVLCWGANYVGQLGMGDLLDRGGTTSTVPANLPAVDLGADAQQALRRAVAITTGLQHTCVVLDSGEVKCWGFNSGGALGLGDTLDRGDEPDEMGDNLPAVVLGTDGSGTPLAAVRVSAGAAHTCAVFDDGRLKCWGANSAGLLGLGDSVNRGDDPGEMGDALGFVDIGTGRSVLHVEAGRSHTCVLLDSGDVKCWGNNTYGQLGSGDTTSRGASPADMGDNLLPVDLGEPAKALSVGGFHTCALLDSNGVKCWGQNTDGVLGLGDTFDRGGAAGDMGVNLPFVDLDGAATLVAAGKDHSCALLDDGRIKCWGRNTSGQLGLGDVTTRGDDAGEMGGALPQVDLGE